MSFNDQASQEETQEQNIQIYCPQYDNIERGPHLMRFQEKPTGPGVVFLRVGGNYVCQTYDNHETIVGSGENPSDLIEIVTRDNVIFTKEMYLNICDTTHIFYAKEMIWLLAGQDVAPKGDPENCNGGCGGESPNFGAVLVYDYCSGCIRISDRVFASTSGRGTPVSLAMFLGSKKCTTC